MVLDRCSINRLALIWRLHIERMRVGLRCWAALKLRPLSVALAVTPSTAAAAPAAPPAALARLAVAELSAFLMRLLLSNTVFFLRLAAIVVFVRDGMFGNSVVCESLHIARWFTASTSAASTPAPALAAAFTVSAFAAPFIVHIGRGDFGCFVLLVSRFDDAFIGFV